MPSAAEKCCEPSGNRQGISHSLVHIIIPVVLLVSPETLESIDRLWSFRVSHNRKQKQNYLQERLLVIFAMQQPACDDTKLLITAVCSGEYLRCLQPLCYEAAFVCS